MVEPNCASTWTLVATPKFCVGFANTKTSPVAPSTVIPAFATPPSLTPNIKSPSDVVFLIVTSEPLTLMFKSLSAPTVNALVSTAIPNVAEVESA